MSLEISASLLNFSSIGDDEDVARPLLRMDRKQRRGSVDTSLEVNANGGKRSRDVPFITSQSAASRNHIQS